MNGTYDSRIRTALRKLANTIDTSKSLIVGQDNYKDDMAEDLERIADNYEVPVPELPSVTSADEGKVLTVDDSGSWVAGEGGGGGGVLVVNDNNGTLDKTWKEINDAYTSGTAVFISMFNGTTVFAVQVSGLNGDYYAIQIVGNAYFTNTEDGYPVAQS